MYTPDGPTRRIDVIVLILVLLGALVGMCLGITNGGVHAQATQPSITIAWANRQTLDVAWQTPGWACAYWVGGGYGPDLIGCTTDAGAFSLPALGVSVRYSPKIRTGVELRYTIAGVEYATTRGIPPPPAYRITIPWVNR